MKGMVKYIFANNHYYKILEISKYKGLHIYDFSDLYTSLDVLHDPIKKKILGLHVNCINI